MRGPLGPAATWLTAACCGHLYIGGATVAPAPAALVPRAGVGQQGGRGGGAGRGEAAVVRGAGGGV